MSSISNGTLYAVDGDGRLLWYRHDGWADGSFRWAEGSGTPIAEGWGYRTVFAGGRGTVYGIDDEGGLWWNRHHGLYDGKPVWALPAPRQVGQGWGEVEHACSGGDGVVYGLTSDGLDPTTGRRTGGRLCWWRHEDFLGGEGLFAEGSGRTIATGWHDVVHLACGSHGRLYRVQPDLTLHTHFFPGYLDGTGPVTDPGWTQIGSGWDFAHVVAGERGVLYGIEKQRFDPTSQSLRGGDLLSYRHDVSDPRTWVASGDRVGKGWGDLVHVVGAGADVELYGDIGATYLDLGAGTSWLGMPTSDEEAFDGGGRAQTFEHGGIYFVGGRSYPLRGIRLRYTGLACFGETDDGILGTSPGDEPYYVFGVVPMDTTRTTTLRTRPYGETDDPFGEVDAGDTRTDSIELYVGPPFGLSLVTWLMERDFGDPDELKDLAKVGVQAASKAVAAAVGAVPIVGAGLAVAAEAVLSAIQDDLVDLVNDVLDTADDAVASQTMVILPSQMVQTTALPLQHFKGIDYQLETPPITGDGATYKAYFVIEAV